MARICPSCRKSREEREYRADETRSDGLAHICSVCEAEGVKAYADDDPLETVDIDRIEWMAADTRIFGSGACPEAGEVYSSEYLEQVAADTNEVLGELRPFNKLGHSEKQRLAHASGLYSADEEPATGWLTDWRVEEGKLVSSAKGVPKQLAKVFEVGAYRTRSPEIIPYRSQESGKEYPAVVRAGAWLGATAPAFKTLEDVYALYHEGKPPTPMGVLFSADKPLEDETVLALEYAQAGELIWDPEASFADLQREVQAALNPGPGDSQDYYVQDISFQVGTDAQGDPQYKALVDDWKQNMTWVVPFDIEGDRAVVAPFSDWQEAEQAWVAADDSSGATSGAGNSSDFRERNRGTRAETRPMPEGTDNQTGTETQELSEETRGFLSKLFGGREVKEGDDLVKLFAEAAGVPEETDPEKIREAITGAKEEAAKPVEDQIPEGMKLMSEADVAKLSEGAETAARIAEELRIERRDNYLRSQERVGKFTPAEREEWQKHYDENPEITKAVLEKMPGDENLKTFGADDSGDRSLEMATQAAGEEFARAWMAMSGVQDPFASSAPARGEEATKP